MGFSNLFERLIWLALLFSPLLVQATQWTVTSYYQIAATTSYYGGETTDPDYAYTYTTTQTVKAGVTPTAKPISTSTYIRSYDDIKVYYFYLPDGSVRDADILADSDDYYSTYNPNLYTYYVEPITYTAPSSCPTAFIVETVTTVYVPSEVRDQMSPTSVSTSYSVYSRTTSTWVTAFLTASAVPLPSDWKDDDFVYSYYVDNCRNPTATGASYYGPDYDDDDYGTYSGGPDYSDWQVCALITGCTTLKIWIIVVATIIPTLFLLGFLENFFWFRRLMTGKSCLRFGTVCWICISLWVICFTRRADSRTAADQKILREQWKAMSGGTKWRLWWKWGFRRKYPVELLGDPALGPLIPGPAPPMGGTNLPMGGPQPPGPGAPSPIYDPQKPHPYPQGQPYPTQQPYPPQQYPPQPYSPQPYPPQQAYTAPQSYNGATNAAPNQAGSEVAPVEAQTVAVEEKK